MKLDGSKHYLHRRNNYEDSGSGFYVLVGYKIYEP